MYELTSMYRPSRSGSDRGVRLGPSPTDPAFRRTDAHADAPGPATLSTGESSGGSRECWGPSTLCGPGAPLGLGFLFLTQMAPGFTFGPPWGRPWASAVGMQCEGHLPLIPGGCPLILPRAGTPASSRPPPVPDSLQASICQVRALLWVWASQRQRGAVCTVQTNVQGSAGRALHPRPTGAWEAWSGRQEPGIPSRPSPPGTERRAGKVR